MVILIKKIFLYFTAILLLTDISMCQNNFNKTYTFQINKSLAPYVFKVADITPKNESVYQDKIFIINIYKSDGKTLIQSIKDTICTVWGKLELNFAEDPSDNSLEEGNLSDVNFDGYKDLVLVSGIGEMGKNWIFDTYLFSTKDMKFHKNTSFSGLCNLEINYKKKTLTEHISEGCTSQCFTENTFQVINNKPIIIKSLHQYFDEKKEKIRAFIEIYSNGILISKRTVKAQL